MGRTEKKIEKNIKSVKDYLDTINENQNNLKIERDEKKKNKLSKKIGVDIRMLILHIEELNKSGADDQYLNDSLTDLQKINLKKIFPNGLDDDALNQRRIRSIRIEVYKDTLKKIKEAMAKYPPYDPNLPYEEKIKNKIFKAEYSLGSSLYLHSNKNSIFYKPEWNYIEHIDNSPEFDAEEKEILAKCYEMGKKENRGLCKL